MFNWLFTKKRDKAEIMPELAMRANIDAKLKNYKADEDTTTSQFSLADEDKGKKPANNLASNRNADPWGQANPRETGIWNRDDRRQRSKKAKK
jgi:hypothetical protein